MVLNDFLPISKEDMNKLGWERPDFIIVTGDAYVDHPSFGTAVIGRVLTDAGYKVGIISQPNWRNTEDFKALGRPKYAFLVNSGNLDSMVNHYSVGKRRRRTDSFSPGGKAGKRPDRACIVYCNMIRQSFKKVPIILGGVEASLRRFAHYDYWDDKVRRSILSDSEADMLIYGMGEKQILEIAEYMKSGIDISYINHIQGTCYMTNSLENLYDYREVFSFEDIRDDKKKYAKAFKIQYEEQDPIRGKIIVQKHKDMYLVQNPPVVPLNREELDFVHDLNYMRDYHPSYKKMGGVPAIQEVKNSIISERGCFGNCSFCSLAFHQGRIVQSRSHDSIINEALKIIEDKDFKGYINDVGGPTANFRNAACDNQLKHGSCKNKKCLYPKPCKNLKIDHSDYLSLLRKLRQLKGVKKVFIRSGIRYDYVVADQDQTFIKEICQHHVSGQLKVAPEHVSEEVLKYMGKPSVNIYNRFVEMFFRESKNAGKEQYIVPYLMSSHPGSTIKSAIELAEYLRDINYQPEQVQDFYPTPGTLSTAMYYTGLDPITMEKVYVPKTREEKETQRALLQFRKPSNYNMIYNALVNENRYDLIGNGSKALIRDKERDSKKPARKTNINKNRRNSGVKKKK